MDICVSADQQEVADNFVAGRDVFISLPTGAGKSLCYLVLPSIFNLLCNSKSSIIIVVCLLKSLIEDQVVSLVPGSESGDEANKVASYCAHDFARDNYVIEPGISETSSWLEDPRYPAK